MPPQELEEEPLADDPDTDDGDGSIREVVVTIAAALALAWFVQAYVVKPYRIPSGSMENTLHCGDRVLVNRFGFHLGDPERGDVVVFHPPAAVDEQGRAQPDAPASQATRPAPDKDGDVAETRADVNYIKRIVGLPGDEIEVKNHLVYIDGKKLDEPYLHPLPDEAAVDPASASSPATVPKDHYFMMGDHRDNSADSREFGFVPREFFIGEAFMVYWPPKRIGGLPEEDPGGKASTEQDPKCLENVPGQAGG